MGYISEISGVNTEVSSYCKFMASCSLSGKTYIAGVSVHQKQTPEMN